MIDLQTATQLVSQYLIKVEGGIGEPALSLPLEKTATQLHLAIVRTVEYEFGWVFFYDAKEVLEQPQPTSMLVGNAPLIVDKADGQIYTTGTAHPIEHYVGEYRKGLRKRAE